MCDETRDGAVTVATFATELFAVIGNDAVCFGFASIAQPGDRLPQCTHRKKMAPGSHHTPNSWRPDR